MSNVGSTYDAVAQELSPDALASAEVQRVLAMQQAIESGAWVTFLRMATDAPYLQGCLAHMYFPSVRARALAVLGSTGAPMICRALPLLILYCVCHID